MIRSWLQFVVVMLISLSLIAAPCKNCGQRTQAESRDCHKDCCPKPKPVPAKSCSWQPADFDAVESKSDLAVEVPAIGLMAATLAPPLVETFQPAAAQLQPLPPPTSHPVLRI